MDAAGGVVRSVAGRIGVAVEAGVGAEGGVGLVFAIGVGRHFRVTGGAGEVARGDQLVGTLEVPVAGPRGGGELGDVVAELAGVGIGGFDGGRGEG